MSNMTHHRTLHHTCYQNAVSHASSNPSHCSCPCCYVACRSHRELFLKQLTHVRLDRQRLAALPSEVLCRLPAASHLFLQHNRLASVAPLAALPGLKFLVLAHNRLTQVKPWHRAWVVWWVHGGDRSPLSVQLHWGWVLVS